MASRNSAHGGTGEGVYDGGAYVPPVVTTCEARTIRFHAMKERALYRLGSGLAQPRRCWVVPAALVCVSLFLALGLLLASMETEYVGTGRISKASSSWSRRVGVLPPSVEELWVETGGRLDREENYIDDVEVENAVRSGSPPPTDNEGESGCADCLDRFMSC